MKCENLSLCIINKDDASNLQRLIRRAKKFVGEIIVVDIGSKDASVAAALHAGATKVIERPDFLDDDGVLKSFALARNESFKHATKDWKMWLDTDDNLSDWNSLKDFIDHLQSIRDKGDKCTGCMLYDYTWSEDRKTCFQVVHRVRIVHKDDNFVWKNPLNEQLISSHSGFAEILWQNTRVIHLSNDTSREEYERNFKILKKWEAQEPNDTDVCYFLGDQYLILKKEPKIAKDYFKRAIENFPKSRGDLLRVQYRYFLSMFELKEYKKCIHEIEKYIESRYLEKIESNFYWLLSVCHSKTKNKEKAFDYFFYSIQPKSTCIFGENNHGWVWPANALKIKTEWSPLAGEKYRWVYLSGKPVPKQFLTFFTPE